MTPAERIVLYVAQKIADEEATASRTKLLKIIYLIDVEHFRRHRKTLTGWKWIFYHYGPYVMDFPAVLERLDLAGLDELTDRTPTGKDFFRYKVEETQTIEDLVSHAEQSMINGIIKRWALENLNLLLNHVYFYTEPMIDAIRGQALDFGQVRRRAVETIILPADLKMPEETFRHLSGALQRAREKYEEDTINTQSHLRDNPISLDDSYRKSLEKIDGTELHRVPAGLTVDTANT